jgi:hypothetical protein
MKKHLRHFSASYMSNTKWRKVLSAIAESELDLRKATWKLIDSDELLDWGVPIVNPHFPIMAGVAQSVEYRLIEWIRFPKRWCRITDVGFAESQDIAGLKRVLEEAADVCLKEDEEGLTLFGYSR